MLTGQLTVNIIVHIYYVKTHIIHIMSLGNKTATSDSFLGYFMQCTFEVLNMESIFFQKEMSQERKALSMCKLKPNETQS